MSENKRGYIQGGYMLIFIVIMYSLIGQLHSSELLTLIVSDSSSLVVAIYSKTSSICYLVLFLVSSMNLIVRSISMNDIMVKMMMVLLKPMYSCNKG